MPHDNKQQLIDKAYQNLNRAMMECMCDTANKPIPADQKGNYWRLLNALREKFPGDEEVSLVCSLELSSDSARKVLNLAYMHLGMHKFHSQ
jgi:hypothetical protein